MTQTALAGRAESNKPAIRLRLDNWHRACEARGLVSQGERAAALGVNRATIVRLENATVAPSSALIAVILASFVGLPGVRYLFTHLFTVSPS